jgi:uncharacterized protein YecE (DUF72 family)
MTCDIRIGTSGYHYKHWQGPFYTARIPAIKLLDFYARHFNTVELNNSFYRLPTELAFDEWRRSTPSNFVFAVRASRFLTHNKKLTDPQSSLDKLLPRIARLGTKLGPVLFQLPPRWRVNHERLQGLLQLLPTSIRCAFELRDPSWITPGIDELLARLQESGHSAMPCEEAKVKMRDLGNLYRSCTVTRSENFVTVGEHHASSPRFESNSE